MIFKGWLINFGLKYVLLVRNHSLFNVVVVVVVFNYNEDNKFSFIFISCFTFSLSIY